MLRLCSVILYGRKRGKVNSITGIFSKKTAEIHPPVVRSNLWLVRSSLFSVSVDYTASPDFPIAKQAKDGQMTTAKLGQIQEKCLKMAEFCSVSQILLFATPSPEYCIEDSVARLVF